LLRAEQAAAAFLRLQLQGARAALSPLSQTQHSLLGRLEEEAALQTTLQAEMDRLELTCFRSYFTDGAEQAAEVAG
jgi:hypothetical protein